MSAMNEPVVRASCPVCAYSVRVREGLLVPHPAVVVRVPGVPARLCPGSGRKP